MTGEPTSPDEDPPNSLCREPTMQLKKLFKDDDAVSPVIGVILMVAITVILAAVIATFVLGLGEQVSDTAPQASFSFDIDDSDNIRVTHTGGPTIPADQLSLSGADVDENWDGGGDDVSAGDTHQIDSGDYNNGETLNVVWESEDRQNSAILQSFDIPDN